jgi:uncharacterized membrane protein (DUF2068 family)
MATVRSVRKPANVEKKAAGGLLWIALFKLFKATLLIAVGIGAHKLLHRDIAATALHWVEILRVDPDNRYIHRLLARIFAISPAQLKATSIGTFIYAALLLTEGLGLLLRKTWAEYFTIITTAGLIPLEVYEISRHVTLAKFVVLTVNVAIVIYLIAYVRKSSR